MSVAGLCCCSLCGADVLDFELQVTPTYPWQINKADWVARFSIEDVYFNVIANEPYEIPAACQYVGVEDFNDCCGGPSHNQICCPVAATLGLCPPCFESNCGCPSCENTGKITCGGVQGNWLAPTVATNYLNVDGDARGQACCDCANSCSVNAVLNSACNADQDVIVPCPNLDEGSAIHYFGNATYDTSTMYRMSRIPCDNTTAAASPAVAMGKWTFTNPPKVTSSTLLWGHGNVLYKDESVDTACDTIIIKFISDYTPCYAFSPPTRYASATYGKRFGPPTNKYTAGAFVSGRYYKISSIGSTNFTLIGAASNTVGLVFFSTGVGTGTGTAYLARTAAELALNYTGPYKLRCVETESSEQLVAGVYYSEWNLGNHTWIGTEAPTYVAGTLGDCSCLPLFGGCFGSPTQGTCGTALTADYPTCVNAFTDVMSQISNLPDPPRQLVIMFT